MMLASLLMRSAIAANKEVQEEWNLSSHSHLIEETQLPRSRLDWEKRRSPSICHVMVPLEYDANSDAQRRPEAPRKGAVSFSRLR